MFYAPSRSRDIRFIRLWFCDVLGRLKSFAIAPEDLEAAFEEGIGFDGSAIEGFTPKEEADMLAFPDPSTFQVLPWRPKQDGAARIFCDVCTPDRKPFAGDPRECLRRMFYRAEARGYLLNVGAELEYYYFPDERTPEPLDDVGYFDLTPDDSARDLRRETVLMLEKMSIPVEYTFHSSGRSQHGISLRHAEALTASDAIITAKHVIRLEAYQAGIHASFMPKPIKGEAASAMMLHQSLFDHSGNNVFWGEDDPVYHLSPPSPRAIWRASSRTPARWRPSPTPRSTPISASLATRVPRPKAATWGPAQPRGDDPRAHLQAR